MAAQGSKAELRAGRLTARDAIPVAERIEKSLQLADHGLAELQFDPGTVISGFLPIRSEMDLRPLMAGLRGRGARICVPVILDKQQIVFRELVPGAPLVDCGFGTMAPGPEAEVLDPEIMLVPLSAFDARGQRIGYGGGYYDRAIARLHALGRRPQLIGIAFDCQEVASVPTEPHDIGLQALLSESGLRIFDTQIG
ncbi:5-formyltetrahydrofolate cyclo-ligase [Pseudorhizobium marinum]|uniref:5-formyltetrahydrofolate cyclo-ligase n=1 Tax=Pseudorhizobium marinum TaxID=1496690 RepID=UPI000497AD04|nr:5-formyltetrahydrofolate cyclo-ligase [Pseudorhizobium marinum]MBU1316667.1 5-formyltetrahydrofolate cyclo-ligase [Alphaproteobacteria bacterium]MDY6962720.1 5-formyltetrahydrofolate cyclo-ligase [Pseudomonadota bacterium]MBU1548414.1 5-formyltetrahydrofolate cyclo-ligase [Alphaproteobacteria bacterium]MBU2335824.1 5-formyltetrahydrofolate cyclo-ligase [Alphaproteobacteria bacterium]MBU2390781.1 5-formyltetrahydrofolate cyclo-ligase [Alphaproteobacteria bacterium]